MASQSLNLDQNLEGLFNRAWFHGELSREDATQILNEAVANDGESLSKRILYLETNPWPQDIGKNRLAIMEAIWWCDGRYSVSENLHKYKDWDSLVNLVESSEWDLLKRKNPFSLQVLATVKAASCNLETQQLPTRIEEEVQRYQDLNGAIKANWDYKLKFVKPTRK